MTKGPIEGIKYLHNGQVTDVAGFNPDTGAAMYYEVIRLIGGRFLFLDDHLGRLKKSLADSETAYPGDEFVLESLGNLVRENPIRDGNIRICVQLKDGLSQLLCYFIPYHYPEAQDYVKGVKLITYPHERPRPGIKLWDDRFRTDVKRTISERGVYEALLVNRRNEITEGSRSNIFFVKHDGTLLTSPQDQVLPGITRKYLIQCAIDAGIKLEESVLELQYALDLPACFISGTSPKVLPVRQIDNHFFKADHPIIQLLMHKFEDMIEVNLRTIP